MKGYTISERPTRCYNYGFSISIHMSVSFFLSLFVFLFLYFNQLLSLSFLKLFLFLIRNVSFFSSLISFCYNSSPTFRNIIDNYSKKKRNSIIFGRQFSLFVNLRTDHKKLFSWMRFSSRLFNVSFFFILSIFYPLFANGFSLIYKYLRTNSKIY